jgi:uncharacterized protein YjcR
MHGGATGSGAPKGNKNALSHGTYTEAAVQRRAELRLLIEQSTELLRRFEEDG